MQKLRILAEHRFDSTDYLRQLYPDLTRIWDELDDLRGAPDSVSADEYQEQEDRADHWISLAHRAANAIDELVANEDMSEGVQKVLEKWADLLDGRVEE